MSPEVPLARCFCLLHRGIIRRSQPQQLHQGRNRGAIDHAQHDAITWVKPTPGVATMIVPSRRAVHDPSWNYRQKVCGWVVNSIASLANMLGYSNTLRSISGGRATFKMQFDYYEELPGPIDDPLFNLPSECEREFLATACGR
jgi:translation elongation factor EF-G